MYEELLDLFDVVPRSRPLSHPLDSYSTCLSADKRRVSKSISPTFEADKSLDSYVMHTLFFFCYGSEG